MGFSTNELYWAAGFLEGEGSFDLGINRRKNRPGLHHTYRVRASQVQREPLERLARYFGGSITLEPRNQANANDAFAWGLTGRSAIALMMTLYALMSPKRQEKIRHAIEVWKTRPNHPQNRIACPQGHPYDRIRLSDEARTCTTCERAAVERYRRRLGVKATKKTSNYRGVSFQNGSWRARINIGGKEYRIGQFPYPEAAAVAYNVYARKIYGENYPFLSYNQVEMG